MGGLTTHTHLTTPLHCRPPFLLPTHCCHPATPGAAFPHHPRHTTLHLPACPMPDYGAPPTGPSRLLQFAGVAGGKRGHYHRSTPHPPACPPAYTLIPTPALCGGALLPTLLCRLPVTGNSIPQPPPQCVNTLAGKPASAVMPRKHRNAQRRTAVFGAHYYLRKYYLAL